METPTQDSEPGLIDILGVVKRRATSILLVFLAVTVLGTAVAFVIPPEFEATTLVRVEDPDTVGSFFTGIGLPIPHKQILTSIDLDIRRGEFLRELIERIDIDEGYRRGDQREYNRLMDRVLRNLKVKLVPQKLGPDYFEITYSGRDGAKVATFVNAIRDKYQAEFERRYRDDIRSAHDTVKAIRDAANNTHILSTSAFERFQATEGAEYGHPDDAYTRFRDRLLKLEQDRDAIDADYRMKSQALTDTDAQIAATTQFTAAGSTKTISESWKAQKARVDALEESLAQLAKRVLPAHRDFQKTKASLEIETARLAKIPQWDETSQSTAQNQVWIDLDTRRKSLQVEAEGLKTRLGRLDSGLLALRNEIKSVPDKVSRATDLKAAVDRTMAELSRASAAFSSARTTKERFVDKSRSLFVSLKVPTPKEVSEDDPIFPNLGLIIGLGAVIGLLLGTGIAFVREFATPSFTAASQVASAIPVPLLGSVGSITTLSERRESTARNRTTWVVCSVVVVLLGWAHIAYFNKGLNNTLPRWAYESMRRIYGKN